MYGPRNDTVLDQDPIKYELYWFWVCLNLIQTELYAAPSLYRALNGLDWIQKMPKQVNEGQFWIQV